MTASTLSPCGRHFPTQEEAASHKLALNGQKVPVRCALHAGWRLEKVKAAQPAKRTQSAPQPFPRDVAAALDERDECCQHCGGSDHLERHHRRGKAAGGSRRRRHTQCTCNGIRLCRRCHRLVHTNERRRAGAQGFIVSQSVDEPASVGVMRFAAAEGGATQWPTCDGQWASTAAEAREAA